MTATNPTDVDTHLDTERDWREFDDRDERRDAIALDLGGALDAAGF